jgi:hypothetical protein
MYDFFINKVKRNLHVCLCFSPVGSPLGRRASRFPSLINHCTVIDWFQPWPYLTLYDVAKRFLGEVDLGEATTRESIIKNMSVSLYTHTHTHKHTHTHTHTHILFLHIYHIYNVYSLHKFFGETGLTKFRSKFCDQHLGPTSSIIGWATEEGAGQSFKER